MKQEVTNSSWEWRKPLLTQEGQKKFWDNQAPNYEDCSLTTENQLELDLVVEIAQTYPYQEIITLGGAVGCRDPKTILDQAYSGIYCWGKNVLLPKVIFNDLSDSQVRWAEEHTLREYVENGVDITFVPGAITDICDRIQSDLRNGSRALILGIYRAPVFFKTGERLGLDEYFANSSILGEHYWFDWLLADKEKSLIPTGVSIDVHDPESVIREAKDELFYQYHNYGENFTGFCFGDVADAIPIIALQVVASHRDQEGFFLSHWFTPLVDEYLKSIFLPEEFLVERVTIPKGYVYKITPNQRPIVGLITMLNNVLGNILPQDQTATLNAIKAMM